MSAIAEASKGVVADPLALADEVVAAWGSLFMVRRRRPGGDFEYLMTPLDEVRFFEPPDGEAGGVEDRAALAAWLRSAGTPAGVPAADPGSGWGVGDLVFGIAGDAAGPLEGLPGAAAPRAFAPPVRTALRYEEGTGRYVAEGLTKADREEAREVLDQAMSAAPSRGEGPATAGFTLPAAEYSRQLNAVTQALERGDLYQAVVSVGVRSRALVPFGEHVARVGARFANTDFGYCVRWDRGSGFFGFCSLPHLLLHDGAIETRVLAGTRRRAQEEAVSLEARRHAAEHLMLVDVERSDFARVCEVGTVEALPRETLDAGESEYLSTTVRGRLRAGVDWAAAVVNSFPRAVVVGAPKAAALAYLARLEDRPRGHYGGVTGVVGRDRRSLLSIVNVAYAERTGDEVLARCGGGITHRSTAAAELAELEVKLEPHQ
jgi:anthranilate/para-aminobenzoate synthase component I